MGDLPVQIPQQLFPDDLRDHLALRLIGGHVLGEKERAVRRVFFTLVQQRPDPVVELGRDGHDGVEIKTRGIGGDDRQKLLLVLDRVDLIDD